MTTKTFPIVIETWTEYERGWGSRPDGATIHLSVADHKAFVDAFNKKHNNKASAPDEYTSADMQPKVIDVEEPLYDRLVALKAKGEFGMWAGSREDEKLIRAGQDPAAMKAKSFDVVMANVNGSPVAPEGANLAFSDANKRLETLSRAGIECKLVESKS